MATITFDTMKLVDVLEQAQIPREQARAIVNVVRESHDAADVATKGDLREVRNELHSAIEIVRRDLIIKLGGMMIAGFGTVIAVLFKLLS